MQSLKRIRKRTGRCYELAWKAVLAEPRTRLVHGWVEHLIGGKYRGHYGHAWVLLPRGRVYDPVQNKYFSAHDYTVQYHAIVGRVFAPRQAAKAALRHGHYGPWWTPDESRLHIASRLETSW